MKSTLIIPFLGICICLILAGCADPFLERLEATDKIYYGDSWQDAEKALIAFESYLTDKGTRKVDEMPEYILSALQLTLVRLYGLYQVVGHFDRADAYYDKLTEVGMIRHRNAAEPVPENYDPKDDGLDELVSLLHSGEDRPGWLRKMEESDAEYDR